MTSTLRGGRGLPKCRCGKGGCMDLVLWIWPECRQGGGGVQNPEKLCRRHLGMAPPLPLAQCPTDRPKVDGECWKRAREVEKR